MSLKDISIKNSYTGKGSNILNDFLLPSLNNSIQYDRISGFFTFDSLISIANGIDSIRIKNGHMRLIIGVHSVPQELLDAVYFKDQMSEEIKEIQDSINKELNSFGELLIKKKIATLAWMIDSNLLEVKTAVIQGEGLFHPKTIILKDELNNEIAAVGSPNETRNGLGDNFEQLIVVTSWSSPEAVDDQKNFFDSLWLNKNNDAIVLDITKDLAFVLKNSLGNEYDLYIKSFVKLDNPLKIASNMPVNFFISGKIPSLFQHQELAVIDGISRWPVRALLADEVGLGKTFEAASILTYLNTFCNVKKILILTPKSVLKQWQDELYKNFNLYAWMFDSASKTFIGPDDRIIFVDNQNPLGKISPPIVLMSAQYCRGTKSSSVLLESDTILPELLIVDEAHSARVSIDLGGNKKKTKMYKMLESVSSKIPHLILATATPMQKNSFEYHAMLKLLGLPKVWDKEDNFLRSLNYITSDNITDLSDANKIVAMLYSTVKYMKPGLSILKPQEIKLLDEAINLFEKKDKFNCAIYIQNNWKNIKPLFIKLHPARLLTIRNTRSSLTSIGYRFPTRNLHEKSIYESLKINEFYRRLFDFLNNVCFSVEKELYPDKKQNSSFIKISYHQRMTSSLYSCKSSLNRRLTKIRSIKQAINRDKSISYLTMFDDSFDDLDFDDAFSSDLDLDYKISENVNINNLKKYIDIEELAIKQLIKELDEIIKTEGDQKITESIKLAVHHVNKGDSVLLFSRYTDTVDSLLLNFKSLNVNINYAIYTGNRSILSINDNESKCDKEQIKDSLNKKEIQIVFCSDAASEGLNLQAARVLINVDVPWTPSRLEQRIGRIARLGQAANEVEIYNIWYPNSVEAKMYTRIQNRLKDANIAIGEFPDIVAESIKNSILDNEPDNSITLLNQIRNNLQTEALSKLWDPDAHNQTDSDLVRKSLLNLLIKNYKILNFDSEKNEYTFMLDNQNIIIATDNPGKKESINISMLLNSNFTKQITGLNVINSDSDYPLAFVDINNKMIKLLSIIQSFIMQDTNFDYYKEYPVSLPKADRLNLLYAINIPLSPDPKYWP